MTKKTRLLIFVMFSALVLLALWWSMSPPREDLAVTVGPCQRGCIAEARQCQQVGAEGCDIVLADCLAGCTALTQVSTLFENGSRSTWIAAGENACTGLRD
ncbi:MAG TPA: hypothetical protein VF469_22255 [Kofleriaceae bacterium]